MVNGAQITGDADWGKAQVGSIGGEYAVSEVRDLQTVVEKNFTITRDAYGSGTGNVKLSIRGQISSFLWDDGTPIWQEYTTPFNAEWRYVQLKIEWKV